MARGGREGVVLEGIVFGQRRNPGQVIQAGQPAETSQPDGEPNGNSPFTSSFLSALNSPAADVRLLMGRVRDEMQRRAPGIEPYVYQSLGGRQFVLNDLPEPEPVALVIPEPGPDTKSKPGSVDTDAIMQDFTLAENFASLEAWGVFLDKYADFPDHLLVRLAESKRDNLQIKQNSEESQRNHDSKATSDDNMNDVPPQLDITLLPGPTPEPETILIPLPEAAKELQRSLRDRDCYQGAIDGILGRNSRAAFERYAKVAGLSEALPSRANEGQVNVALKAILDNPDFKCEKAAAPAPRPQEFTYKKEKFKTCEWLGQLTRDAISSICSTRTKAPAALSTCPRTCSLTQLSRNAEALNKYLHRTKTKRSCDWLNKRSDRAQICSKNRNARGNCPTVCKSTTSYNQRR